MTAGNLLSGETGAMLGYAPTKTTTTVNQQAPQCGVMEGCKKFSQDDQESLSMLGTFLIAVNNRFDQLTAVAHRSGHRYLEANEESRVTVEAAVPPGGN